MANVYSDSSFESVPFVKKVEGLITLPVKVMNALTEDAEYDFASVCDFDLFKVSVTNENIVYDIYLHKYTLEDLKGMFPDCEIFKWVDDTDTIYKGNKYYVVRVIK